MARRRLRRYFFFVLALGSLLVLILAAAGVFARKRLPFTYERISVTTGGDVIIDGLRSEGADWLLTARRAYREASGQIRMEAPCLSFREKPAAGTVRAARQVTIYADRGMRASERDPEIRLEQNVVVQSRTEGESITLRCGNLVWDDRTGRATIGGHLEVAAEVEGNQYFGSGEDATAEVRVDRLRIERAVHLVLTGEAGVLPQLGGGQGRTPPEGEATRTHVFCAGPLLADGNAQTARLLGGVNISRGADRLRADRLTVFQRRTGAAGLPGRTTGQPAASDAGAKPPRTQAPPAVAEFEAEGNVELVSNTMAAECDTMRRDQNGKVTLLGRPARQGQPPQSARIRQERSEFEATAIEMTPAGIVTINAPGRITIRESQGDGESTVIWGGRMEYDRERGRAFFHGGIQAIQPQREIRAQRLTLTLAPESGDVQLLVAEGEAEAKTEQGLAKARVLTFDVGNDALTLEGQPLARLDQGERFVEGPRLRIDRADGIMRCEGAGRLVNRGVDASAPVAQARPGEIVWAERMEYDEKRESAKFRGKVVLAEPDRILRADSLDVTFGEERRVKAMRCDGPGSLTGRGAARGTAAGAAGERNIVWQKRMDYAETEHTARFEGTVVFTEPGRGMRADVIDAKFDAEGGLQSLAGQGNVRYDSSTGEEKIKLFAEAFTYNVRAGSGLLSGGPARIWSQRGGWVVGRRIVFKDQFRDILVTDPHRIEGAVEKPPP